MAGHGCHPTVPAAELDPAGDQGCRRDGDGRPARRRLRGLDKEEAEEIYQKFKEAKPSTPGPDEAAEGRQAVNCSGVK